MEEAEGTKGHLRTSAKSESPRIPGAALKALLMETTAAKVYK